MPAPPRQAPPHPSDVRLRVGLVAAVGLAVGCLTSFGQTYLGGALNAFVNSASAWLVVPFAVGACMASVRGAGAAGLAVCGWQLAGYELTAHLRGFPALWSLIVFWAACAVVGGPVFGVGGRLWRAGRPDVRGLGAAVLASVFLAEGLWLYIHELHYYTTALIWIGIGTLVGGSLLHGLREYRWLAVTLPLGLVGEVVLTRIHV
ncbi:MAG TPA: DUF6518 family protein [Solirubrobacteraceae bacterium]